MFNIYIKPNKNRKCYWYKYILTTLKSATWDLQLRNRTQIRENFENEYNPSNKISLVCPQLFHINWKTFQRMLNKMR